MLKRCKIVVKLLFTEKKYDIMYLGVSLYMSAFADLYHISRVFFDKFTDSQNKLKNLFFFCEKIYFDENNTIGR